MTATWLRHTFPHPSSILCKQLINFQLLVRNEARKEMRDCGLTSPQIHGVKQHLNEYVCLNPWMVAGSDLWLLI